MTQNVSVAGCQYETRVEEQCGGHGSEEMQKEGLQPQYQGRHETNAAINATKIYIKRIVPRQLSPIF
jgi:hypothetical protein